MIEEAKQAVKKEEEDDLDGPISAISRKSLMKMEPIFKDRLDDDDDVPLAFSSAKRKKLSNPSKMKKEKLEDDEDEKPLKRMEGLKKRLSDSYKVKKEEREDDEDEKPLKKNRKRKRTEEKRTVVKLRKVEASKGKLMNGKKEKKAYELPGQKHDPPELRDPLRIFYETLYEQVPTSEMAAIWMMERGLLSLEEAQKVYAKKLRKTHNQKFGSPAKGTTTPVKKSSTISVKEVKVTSKTAVKTTKKKVIDSDNDDDDDDDDDFVLTKLDKKKKHSS